MGAGGSINVDTLIEQNIDDGETIDKDRATEIAGLAGENTSTVLLNVLPHNACVSRILGKGMDFATIEEKWDEQADDMGNMTSDDARAFIKEQAKEAKKAERGAGATVAEIKIQLCSACGYSPLFLVYRVF